MIKTSTIYRTICIVAICLFSVTVYTYSSNPPVATAGDPGNGNCTSCHSGSAITSGTAWSSIALTGLPTNGYIPGTIYTLTMNGNSAATSKNGFQLTSLNASNAMAGAITASTGTGLQTSSGITYISQSGSNSSSWSFNWTAPLSGTGTVTFYAAFNGSNANSGTGGDNIYLKTFSISQAATNLPTAIITPSTTNVCLGDTLFLTGSGLNNPTTFNWQFLNHSPSTGSGQNVFVIYTTIGTKTIRLTTSNADGTSPVVGINVNVLAKPTATISAPNGLTICNNDSIILQANTGTGLQYLWTPGSFTTSSIKVADSINYRVRVTNSNGCFVNSSFVKPIKVGLPQSVLFASKDTICKNDSVIFDLSGGGFTAQYFVNDTLVQTSTNPMFNFKSNIGGVYKITPKITLNGCSNTLPNKFISVQEQAIAPIVLCGNSTTSSMQFTWLQVAGFSNYEISTNNGNSWNDANGASQLSHIVTGLLPNSTVNIMVRAKAIGPCGAGNTGLKTCVNNGCNPINIVYEFNNNICINSLSTSKQTTIELKTISNPKYLVQYEFENAVSVYSRNTLFNFDAKTGNNLVRIKIKDSTDNVCPVVDSTFVVKGNMSPIKPNIVPDKSTNNYCIGENITAKTTKGTNSHLFNYYQIIPTRKLLFSSSLDVVNFKNLFSANPTNSVKAIVIDTLTSCSDSSNEVSIIIYPNPISNFSFEYFKSDSNNVNKNKVVFTNLSSDTTSSLWLFGDLNNSSSLLNNASFTYNKGGNYTVKLVAKNINNCTDTSSKQIIITNTAIESLLANSFIKVYPNPANNFITIELLNNNYDGLLSLVDLTGKQVHKAPLNKSQVIPINDLNNGFYLVKIEIKDKVYYTKFLKN
ncbi:MAG: T9SS type A sorting domain-containing protein [Bacteroidia bacterium]|nr:T9SS type A sorting domain-containing protein [Bacteroidia bacterium]